MTKHGYNQEELTTVIGKSRTSVNEMLSLNGLPEEIKNDCRTPDSPSKSVLIEIAHIGTREQQLGF